MTIVLYKSEAMTTDVICTKNLSDSVQSPGLGEIGGGCE